MVEGGSEIREPERNQFLGEKEGIDMNGFSSVLSV